MKKTITLLSAIAIIGGASAKSNKNTLGPAKAENIQKVVESLPEKAPAKPRRPRKILVVSRCEGFVHRSIPLGVKAIRLMGEKTGAYTIEETQEMEDFNEKNLKQFDAILFLSTIMLDPAEEQRKTLLDFVRGEKGIIGITWVRPEGKGRVFYCSMGHNSHIFWDARILQHYLAGIQYALGDYKVPDQIK